MNSLAVKIWLMVMLLAGASYAAYKIKQKSDARRETARQAESSAAANDIARPPDGIFLAQGTAAAMNQKHAAAHGSAAVQGSTALQTSAVVQGSMAVQASTAAQVSGAVAVNEIPPIVVDLDTFTMTERSGKDMSFGELRGQVWIGSMFYASCPYSCRALNQRIAALHREPQFKDVRFVSISVDPATDTPEKLRATADILGADPQRWLFFNGKLDDVERLGKQAKVTAGYQEHQDRLILFDRQGHVRGWFHFKDDVQIDRLREAVPKLLAEEARDQGSGVRDQNRGQDSGVKGQEAKK